MFIDYFIIFGLFLLAFLLSVVLFLLSYFTVLKDSYYEKVSIYECGFEPFEDTRRQFDVHYYLTAVVFIVFDLEFIYLFPWFSIRLPGLFRYYSYLFFLVLLGIGLIYELQTGALDWTYDDEEEASILTAQSNLARNLPKTENLPPSKIRWFVYMRLYPFLLRSLDDLVYAVIDLYIKKPKFEKVWKDMFGEFYI